MNDRERIMQTLVACFAYYDRELTDFAAAMWGEDLRGLSADVVEAAFTRHRRDPDRGQFMPKIADILRHIRGSLEHEALIAWGGVLQLARGGGGPLEGPAAEAVASLGGLSVVQRADESRNTFLQRQFVDAYRAFAQREEAPPLLARDELLRIASKVGK